MTDVIRVRDLMRAEFASIRTDQTFGEAMTALREARRIAGMPNALMVVGPAGEFVGMLTAKLLVRILVVRDESGGAPDDATLLRAAQQRLSTLVGDVEIPHVPVATPGDRLLKVIRRGIPTRLDFVPIVDGGRPVGLVPVTKIFESAASIALTPEHEGIRFDR